MIFWLMGKISRKAKIQPGDFQVATLKNPLINNQAVTSIRNFTTTIAYPKIPTYNWPLLQYAIGPNLVKIYFFLHGSQYVTNFLAIDVCCWMQCSSLQSTLKIWKYSVTKAWGTRECSSFSKSIWVLWWHFKIKFLYPPQV